MIKSSAYRQYKSESFKNFEEIVFSNQDDEEQNIWSEAVCRDKFPEFNSELKARYDENLEEDDIFAFKEDNSISNYVINCDYGELEQSNQWVAVTVHCSSFIEEQKENSISTFNFTFVNQDSKTENKNINKDNIKNILNEKQNKEVQKNIESFESLKKRNGVKKEINPNKKCRFSKDEDRGRIF